jgi:hypothetical protein
LGGVSAPCRGTHPALRAPLQGGDLESLERNPGAFRGAGKRSPWAAFLLSIPSLEVGSPQVPSVEGCPKGGVGSPQVPSLEGCPKGGVGSPQVPSLEGCPKGGVGSP